MTFVESQHRLALEQLRRAGERPVSLAALRAAGFDAPAAVISELELNGHAIERVYEHGRLLGLRLIEPEDDTGARGRRHWWSRRAVRVLRPRAAYCTYSFFEQCPHRMACARCDFYLPSCPARRSCSKPRTGLQRMLVEIPLDDDERTAVEGDERAVGRLVDRLADVATPAGPIPSELDQATRRARTPLRLRPL